MMKTNNLVLLSMIATFGASAHAAQGDSRGNFGGGNMLSPGIAPMIAVGSDMNITNADVTKLISQQMAAYFERQKEDKEFFVRSINEIESAANKINSELVIGQLTVASQQSQLMSYVNQDKSSGAIKVEEFFVMMNRYNTAKQVLENKIQGILAMSKGALPSASVIVTEKKDAVIPAYLSVDFEKIAGFYASRLKAMDAQIDTLNFKIQDKAGINQDVVGFHIDLSKMKILTVGEVQQRQAAINALRRNIKTLEIKQDEYTSTVKTLVETHLTNFGSSERLRILNDKDIAARKRDYQRLTELFWARSYLRQKYGIPLGSIGTIYKKQFLSIEEFLKNPKDFVQFEKASYRSKNDLVSAEESYRNSASVIEKKAASIFDGNFSLVARANALLTKATGWGPLAESAEMVLKLLAADVQEELLLMEGGGQLKVRDFFKKRYMSDETSKAATLKLLCEYDADAQPEGKCGSADDATTIDQDRLTEGDPVAKFRLVLKESDVQLESFAQARTLQEQLDALTKFKSNPLNKAVKKGNASLWE